ncbi:hypothetical protein [Bacillus sp. 1P06AnD]|uniref:hypothetical protein n=1 Tax=Bacillus sp. 1P06AnD TaxID=3132208 RepID=UPI0039A2D2AB
MYIVNPHFRKEFFSMYQKQKKAYWMYTLGLILVSAFLITNQFFYSFTTAGYIINYSFSFMGFMAVLLFIEFLWSLYGIKENRNRKQI